METLESNATEAKATQMTDDLLSICNLVLLLKLRKTRFVSFVRFIFIYGISCAAYV